MFVVSDSTHRRAVPDFFSNLQIPWWQNPIYNDILQELRHPQSQPTREIWIVTSGPLNPVSTNSFLDELERAEAMFPCPAARNVFQWHAMNHQLNQKQVRHLTQRFANVGAVFKSVSVGQSHTSTSRRMYDARDSVTEYLLSIQHNPIVCWLDSDLIASALLPVGDGLRIGQPWPWLHMVWYHWVHDSDADYWVGDVTGDPPIPASSTIFSNLTDLVHSGPTAGHERWNVRDPSYDFSEIARDVLPFPPIALGEGWEHGLTESLLWRGTLYRPLTASVDILRQPHRPWFVRGGVTIIFNNKALIVKTPRFRYDKFHLRRGDSFWVIRNKLKHNITPRHWPFPLLHQRVNFSGPRTRLIRSFHDRFVEDLISASCLKSFAASITSADIDFAQDFLEHLQKRCIKSKEVFLASKSLVNANLDRCEALDIQAIHGALDASLQFVEKLNLEGIVNDIAPKVVEYIGD